MREYLVESYLGRSGDFAAITARATAAAAALEEAGVRHLRSTFVDEDELCLHWFASPTRELVLEAAARAAIRCDRVVAAFTIEKGEARC